MIQYVRFSSETKFMDLMLLLTRHISKNQTIINSTKHYKPTLQQTMYRVFADDLSQLTITLRPCALETPQEPTTQITLASRLLCRALRTRTRISVSM
jgi:hypothetical protein